MDALPPAPLQRPCLITCCGEVIGWTRTRQEAEALCARDHALQWDRARGSRAASAAEELLPQLISSLWGFP